MWKTFASVTLVAVLSVSASLAQDAPKGPQWKDTAEYDLVTSIGKEADPTKKIALLDTWKQKYPETEFKEMRLILYLQAYQAAQNTPKAVETAKELLTVNPRELNALYFLTNYGQIVPPTPDSLATGEKAARALLTLEKPPTVPDEATWEKAKLDLEVTARTTLGYIAAHHKQHEAAVKEYKRILELKPNNARASFGLGSALIAQQKPELYSEALFHFARAASLTGPEALPPDAKKQVDALFVKYYETYHGPDPAGMKELRALATGPKPAPPDGFKIKSKIEIEQERAEKLKSENPSLALWLSIKEQLTAENGQQYFESSMKNALLPGGAGGITKFEGTLVSHDPATRPKELVLAISDATTPEVTLRLESPLPGKADPGTKISFEGAALEFTKEPFMVIFAVEDASKIEGWPAQAPPPAKKRAPAKKPAKK
jgi:tetratricopeptide (TPR) repeat protein